jgi:nitrogen fixation NifU-like protein
MSDLRDLYQEVILDHNKRPRNLRRLDDANRKAEGYNPLCGDKVVVYLKLEGDIVRDVSFEGSGCAISTASASMMTESLKGRTVDQVRALFQGFHDLVTGHAAAAPPAGSIGKLAAFGSVCEFPVRVKCATLPWHTLRAALDGSAGAVTTE